MATINRWIGIGRLVRDPELRVTPNGTSVCNFTMAINRPPAKDGSKETDFIDIVTFGKTAEACAQYLGKGKMVAVEGPLQVRTWEAKDGGKRKTVEVIGSGVQFLSPKES